MISAIFDGAAHVTVAGCLGAFFFKHTVVDRTSKAIKEAENVTAGLVISEFCISVAVLVLASNETARILLSKDGQPPPKHNLAELNAPLICNKVSDFSTAADSILSNPIATEPCSIPPSISIATEPRSTPPDLTISLNSIANDSCTSPSTTCSAICTPILPTSPVQNTKRLSIDSGTTLVDHDDDFVKGFFDADLRESTIPQDDSDCSSSDLLPWTKALTINNSSGPFQRPGTQLQPNILEDGHLTTTDISLLVDASTQTITPRLKPPDTKRHQNFRPARHKCESRSTRLAAVRGSIERTHSKQLEHATVIDDLEQLHDDLLADQTALVDGWAAAMAQLGLPSMLSPAPLLLDQKTPDSGNSIEIIQDRHLHPQFYSRGPLRPNTEDLQRPPSLSPTTWSFMPARLKATTGRVQTMSSRRPVIPAVFDVGRPLRPIPTQPQPHNRLLLVSRDLELKATVRGSHIRLSQVSSLVFAIV
ncbi:uncharacterized protein F5891DRAFT_400826 [Suillus fuscotomentosus]|uniref:Uncharacterized protein n=1 Tax=Suillus fuscotomentosus TaxID=1912939 RepID=A0AAD4HK52_9AGAM|nr:uncharacterized protein F5891DRAFT_400826 [Suillus fuscotomentosus]KAG1899487.1 hypothetical protein F5891DRAFT_400826 [Suillus fuscotomentosus]